MVRKCNIISKQSPQSELVNGVSGIIVDTFLVDRIGGRRMYSPTHCIVHNTVNGQGQSRCVCVWGEGGVESAYRGY